MVASKNVSLVLLKILPPTANAALVTTTHPVFLKKNFDPVNWLVEETSHLRYSLIPWAEKTSFSYERKVFCLQLSSTLCSRGVCPASRGRKHSFWRLSVPQPFDDLCTWSGRCNAETC